MARPYGAWPCDNNVSTDNEAILNFLVQSINLFAFIVVAELITQFCKVALLAKYFWGVTFTWVLWK